MTISQKEFNKLMSNYLNGLAVGVAGDVSSRTNLKILGYSATRGAGLQMITITPDVLLKAVITADLDYKLLEMAVTQASTSAPTVSELTDDAGVTITGGYTSAGIYTLTADSAIFVAGTRAYIAQNSGADAAFEIVVTSTTVLTIKSRVMSTGVLTDALMTGVAVLVKIPVS